jgi:hypothetical protein
MAPPIRTNEAQKTPRQQVQNLRAPGSPGVSRAAGRLCPAQD